MGGVENLARLLDRLEYGSGKFAHRSQDAVDLLIPRLQDRMNLDFVTAYQYTAGDENQQPVEWNRRCFDQ